MRTSVTLLALALAALAAQVSAQPLNTMEVYSGSTSFTSRGFLGVAGGETLQGYPGAQFRGIGDTGNTPKDCRVFGFGVIAQDQNRTTTEKFKVVLRRDDDTGAPDPTAHGVLVMTGELSLPTSPTAGAAVYNITVNLGSDGVQVPCSHTFFAGIALSPNANWTADGQSTHASAYTTPASAVGDPVRATAVNHAYQIDAQGAVRATNPRAWRYRLLTQRGVFQVGCVQPGATTGKYGFCGVYPDAATQGLSFRLMDAANAGRTGAVFISTALIGGAPLPFDGLLFINPGTLIMIGSGTLDANGNLELTPPAWAPGKLTNLVGLGNVAFQAVIESVGNGRFDLRMMNAQATNL